MLRIRGTVGDVPVDLTVELDDSDWAKLGSALGAQPQIAQAAAVAVPAASSIAPARRRAGVRRRGVMARQAPCLWPRNVTRRT